MAYKYRTFKKYENNRKSAERLSKKIHRKGISYLKKASRREKSAYNQRMREYKREREKRNSLKQKTSNNTNSFTQYKPITFGDFLYGCGFMVSIVVMLILFFVIGFWKTILLATGLFFSIMIILVVIDEVKAKKNPLTNNSLGSEEPKPEDRSIQLPYLKSLREELRKHQTIANTSNDPDEVKKHLDCLLGVMDEIMTFDEAMLKQAGMTKANYESTKAELLEVYDAMITQARNSNETDSSPTG